MVSYQPWPTAPRHNQNYDVEDTWKQNTASTQHIETDDLSTIWSRPYGIPHAQKETIEKHFDDMLNRDVMQPSTSPRANPVVLVPISDGSTMFCVDFRKVNKMKKKDSYPLLLISESFEALGGAKICSSLDMLSVYW